MKIQQVEGHLASHHGVISRVEARHLGMTESQVTRRVKSGEWLRIHRGVFRPASVPVTWLGSARAAALSAGGLVSHRAAAAIWRIDGFNEHRLEVVVAYGQNARANRRVHRSTQMSLADASEERGVPVTGLARTVLDVAAVVGPRRLQWTVDAVLRQQLLDWPDLYHVMVRHSIQGRTGCGRLRALLDERYGDTVIPDSKWNRMVGQLLTDAGLPEPFYEYEISDGAKFIARVDLAYPQCGIAIELDSVRFHLNRESFEKDPRRKNELLLRGWRVLTFTWADYSDHPERLVETVLAATRCKSA